MYVSKFVYRVENTVNQICLCFHSIFVKNILLKYKNWYISFGYNVWNTQWNPNNNVCIL